MSKIKNKKAFFLVEVLLVVVILSVGLVVIVQSLASSLRGVVYSAENSQATILLDNKMNELLLERFVDSGFTFEGSLAGEIKDFQYEIKAVDPGWEGMEDMTQVDIKVSWPVGAKMNSRAVSFYMLGKQM